jgi:indole-3-glycerol phosphate synthase
MNKDLNKNHEAYKPPFRGGGAAMTILDKIIADKRAEVVFRKQAAPIETLPQLPYWNRARVSLKASLQQPGSTGIIAEFKRRSPSKGVINGQAGVTEVVAAYNQAAAGISVLTDEKYFGGTSADLLLARQTAGIPILRKDFMIDTYQLHEARGIGADVVLLIAANLSIQQVQDLAAEAKALGLEVLLEIHNEDELGHICAEVDCVGVNNRNLKTFEVDIQTSLRLIKHIPADKPAIAESGISNVDTIVTLRNAGFKGFLIGENFMKQALPSVAFADFVKELRAAL